MPEKGWHSFKRSHFQGPAWKSEVQPLPGRGTAPGDVRFKAQITSTNLIKPVIEMESTRIYEDQ